MIVVGIEWNAVPASVISRIGARAESIRDRIAALQTVDGVIVLATCARVECYADGTRYHDVQRAFVDEVAQAIVIDRESAQELVHTRRGDAAVSHLFEVASGLRSAVVGEDQIVGQVRTALLDARERGAVSKALGMAFEQAIAVSRRARPLIGAGTRSLAGAALDAIDPVTQALVIGSGALAVTVLDELRDRGVQHVMQHSPSNRAIAQSTTDLAVHRVERAELAEAISIADVVIACSGRSTVVDDECISTAWELRRTPITLIDLTGGIDLDGSIESNPEVRVIGLDDVRTTVPHEDVRSAQEEIERSVLEIGPRIDDSELDELISGLRARAHAVAQESLEGVDDPVARAAARRAVQALLHRPTLRARAAAREGRLDDVRHAVRLLFDDVAIAQPSPATEVPA